MKPLRSRDLLSRTRRNLLTAAALLTLAACGGAGVSTDYLREEVSAEVAQVLVNRSLLAPFVFPVSVDPVELDVGIAAVRERLAVAHANAFAVPELHELRRFYSSQDGQTVAALAYAEEGGRPKADLSAEDYARVETALQSPLNARSISLLRDVLRQAFQAEFAFANS